MPGPLARLDLDAAGPATVQVRGPGGRAHQMLEAGTTVWPKAVHTSPQEAPVPARQFRPAILPGGGVRSVPKAWRSLWSSVSEWYLRRTSRRRVWSRGGALRATAWLLPRPSAVIQVRGLAPIVEGIFGLSKLLIAAPYFQIYSAGSGSSGGRRGGGGRGPAAAPRTFTVEAARSYNLPDGHRRAGERISDYRAGRRLDPDDRDPPNFQNLQVLPQVVAVPVTADRRQGQNEPTGDH